MNAAGPITIGWHADTVDARLASIRYRLLEPMAALAAQGMAIGLLDDRQPIAAYRAILFSKSHGHEAIEIARSAQGAGVPVIFDLCDNLFEGHRAGKVSAQRIARVREMLGLATHLTFSTADLAQQIVALGHHRTSRISVIPDVIARSPAAAEASASDRRHIDALDRFLSRHDGALHCIWFGKSLGALSGYVHVDRAVRELKALARTHPVTLTVQSDERLRFLLARLRWRIPVHYIPWSLGTADSALARHRVAVIPVERNAYTLGKTINRPATALLNDLYVIADPIPAYEELRPFIELDDWQRGLADALSDEPAVRARVAAGQRHLRDHYNAEAIATRWRTVIEGEISKSNA